MHLVLSGGQGWLGIPDLWPGQKLWWNWPLTPVVNFGEVRKAQLTKFTLLSSTLGDLQIFSDILRSVQLLKREWGAESNGKLQHLFVPSKPVTLVPEFTLEDLPEDRRVTLVPAFGMKDLSSGRTLWWWWWFKFSTRWNYCSLESCTCRIFLTFSLISVIFFKCRNIKLSKWTIKKL